MRWVVDGGEYGAEHGLRSGVVPPDIVDFVYKVVDPVLGVIQTIFPRRFIASGIIVAIYNVNNSINQGLDSIDGLSTTPGGS